MFPCRSVARPLAAVLLLSAAAVRPQTLAEPAAAELGAFVEAEMAAQQLTGLSIALLDGEAIVWARGFGMADAERGIAAGPDTVYRVASISKLCTAVLCMQMVERGEVGLDAPFVELLPAFDPPNPFGVPITLRHLLSHHAGILREPLVGHYFEPGGTLAELCASMAERPPVFAPGSRLKYSNAGVAIAGHAAAVRAGQPFERVIEAAVLRPLGMSSSSFVPDSEVARRCAKGFMGTLDGRRFPAPTFALGMAPAGNLWSTMPDLLRFARNLLPGVRARNHVLQPASLAAMWSPHPGHDARIGLGFFLGEVDGHRRVSHGGAIYGFASELAILPDERLAVAVATTEDFANGSTERIADFALRVLLSQKEGRPLPRVERPAPVGAERARVLAGHYRGGESSIELREQGGELVEIPADGLPTVYRAFPGRDTLVSDGRLEARIGARTLAPSEDGVVRNGVRMARVRTEAPPPPPDRFVALIGEYGPDHDVLYVLEDGGRLVCLIEWLVRYPLAELGDERFAMPGHGMYAGEPVTFERGDAGAVVAVAVGGVRFARRAVGGADGAGFRIEPRFSADELRERARAVTPPAPAQDARAADLVDLASLDCGIRFDIRYATTDNFMGMVFYEVPKAMLQRPAARALAEAHARLAPYGLGLLVYDAYRPWSVTKMFWDATPEHLRQFVADPARGSRHNRGCAVDVTLCRLDDGTPVPMPSGYDEFTPRAFPDYPGTTAEARWHRELRRRTMAAVGFEVYEWEWWHFDYRDWREYPVLNEPLR